MNFVPENNELYTRLLEEKVKENLSFDDALFGEPRSMGKSPYPAPEAYPRKNEHPRVFFNTRDVEKIRAAIDDPDYAHVKEIYRRYAEAEGFTGKFPPEEKRGVIYHFNPEMLMILEAKAFSYLMTGNVLHGMEAIVGIKNMMLTLDFKSVIHSDVYHGGSELIVYTARVYDWCYDLLSERDIRQLIGGVSNLLCPCLEFQFPPMNMSYVCGHGTGCQFLRDYVCISLAIFDEMPDWWELVGGRFYAEFAPVINHCYQGGWASQGTSNYGDLKLQINHLCASYIYSATGKFPFHENMRYSSYYMMSHAMSNERYFQTGDGARSPEGRTVTPHYLFLGAMLFGDKTLGEMARYLTKDYTEKYGFGYSRTISAAMLFVWLALAPKVKEGKLSGDLIQYFSYPAGSMTARNSYGADGAVALMRIGEMTMANHDIYDHGTFQIYYKGLLAGSSGIYKKYGSNVHKYYLQATVAQNGILVYNPALGSDEAVIGEKFYRHGSYTEKNCILNGDQYYYCGGQRYRKGAANIEEWLNGNYEMGTVLSTAKGYGKEGEALYAYISGDITKSYHEESVNLVRRNMLTVFTENKKCPLVMLVHDTVEAKDKDFRKSFLLHTNKEPTVNKEEKTAYATYGEGRITLRSLYGADAMEKIGGEGKAYWISNSNFYNPDGTLCGKNCTDEFSPTDNSESIWGRVELICQGRECEEMLNLLIASDAEVEAPEPTAFSDKDGVLCVEVMGILAAFVTKAAEHRAEYTVTVTDPEGARCHIAGLDIGQWQIKSSADDEIKTVTLTRDSSVLSFLAKPGKISLIKH